MGKEMTYFLLVTANGLVIATPLSIKVMSKK